MQYNYDSGNLEEDSILKRNITNLYNKYNNIDNVNKVQLLNEKNEYLKKFFNYNKLDEIKMRFRNISSIMDCVGCQKCRLHGKLQIYGLGTMLKILYEKGDIVKLKRNELIAYINLVSKIHRSVGYMLSMNSRIEEESTYLYIKCGCGVLTYLILLVITNYYYYYRLQKVKKPLYRSAKVPIKKKSIDNIESAQNTEFVYSNEKIKKE
jgi:hypothetical protein